MGKQSFVEIGGGVNITPHPISRSHFFGSCMHCFRKRNDNSNRALGTFHDAFLLQGKSKNHTNLAFLYMHRPFLLISRHLLVGLSPICIFCLQNICIILFCLKYYCFRKLPTKNIFTTNKTKCIWCTSTPKSFGLLPPKNISTVKKCKLQYLTICSYRKWEIFALKLFVG